jgi:hypothetical protein
MGIVLSDRNEGIVQRRALVICNDDFDALEFPTAKSTESDYKALTRVLSDGRAKFEVTGLNNAGFLEVRKAIAKICNESKRDDTLLIYYAGYSFRDTDGSLYLPVKDSTRAYANATTIDTDFVLKHLRHSECRRLVLMLDGNNAGAFFVNNRGIPDGLYAIMACGPDETTPDSEEGGAFTRAFVEALESPKTDADGDGRISADELYERIKAVMARNRYSNVPQKWVWNVRDPIYIAEAAPSVFLSYARQDVELARAVKDQLERRGFSVWIDLEGIHSGDWEARVRSALGKSRCVVFLMTQSGLNSDAVKKELNFATLKGVPLIPLSELEWKIRELPEWYQFHYATIHWQRLRRDALDGSVDELAVAIRELRPDS